MKKIGLFFIILIFIVACSSSSHDHTLKISATTWIGYTPLFYAKEKGWLNEIDVKLINVVSLSENLYLYQAANSDAYCGTQYEYSILKLKFPSLIPVMLFDRSNGGDMIMSNHSIKELQNSTEKIHAYLEMDSINFTLLNDFIKKYKIDENRIDYINRNQAEISTLINNESDKEILIITYIPFNTKLTKSGFTEILSTRNGLDLLVIDALFVRQEEFIFHKNQFIALKKFNDIAIAALHKDPKEFYETIKPYIKELNYEEFKDALGDVEWLNKNLSKKLKERMRDASFATRDLL